MPELKARRGLPMRQGVMYCAGITAVLGLIWLASGLFAPAAYVSVRSLPITLRLRCVRDSDASSASIAYGDLLSCNFAFT